MKPGSTGFLSSIRSKDLKQLLDPQKALQRILKAAVHSTKADSGSFVLINPNTGFLDIEASLGLSERAKRVKLKPGEGITGWVATTGMTVRTGDVRREKRYISINSLVRSELAVPVEMKGQVVGILNVDSANIDAFSSDDELSLNEMAQEAAQWLELAWEIDQLRIKSRQLSQLVDIGHDIIAENSLEETLAQITMQAAGLMNCKLCSVLLVNAEGTELVLEACHGGTEIYRQKPNLPVDDSLVGTVVKRCKPLTVVEVEREKGYSQVDMARNEGLVSLLSVPLIFNGKGFGVINVYTGQRHRFSNDEIKLLTALSDLSAVAIEKGRLLSRVMEMEEKLRLSERLSALGLLAAEVAHEIRNPLTVMQMLFHSMVENSVLDERGKRDAEIIGEKMKQMNRIVDQVLSFARSSEPMKESIRCEQLMDDVYLLTRHKLNDQGIEMRRSVAPETPSFYADRSQVEQVLLNLILNAAHAMPSGGILRLDAAFEVMEGEPYVVLTVRDNGKGMTETQVNNLFAPFLSYTESGTGIGLAIVKKIVENHQGLVEVESRIGGGTRFKLFFPINP